APPVSSAWARLREETRARAAVIAPHGWNDPHGSAELVVQADVAATAALLAERVAPAAGVAQWRERWQAAGRAALAAVEAELASREARGAPMAEHAAVRAAVDALPDGGLLVLGNSLPVRAIETACAGDGRDLGVLSQRGACGI